MTAASGAVTGYRAHIYYGEESRSAAARARHDLGGKLEGDTVPALYAGRRGALVMSSGLPHHTRPRER